MQRRRGVLLLSILLTASCGTQAASGYPLYAKVGAGPGPDKVALLHGPVQTVDDVNVAGKGQTFELMPGCHVVTLQRNIGAGTASGAWAANVGHLVIAFPMRPAHRYVIAMEIEESSAPVGRYMLVARERAPDGSVTRVPFARSDDDILSCKRWAEAQGLHLPQ
jgi:hypothetical protein